MKKQIEPNIFKNNDRVHIRNLKFLTYKDHEQLGKAKSLNFAENLQKKKTPQKYIYET